VVAAIEREISASRAHSVKNLRWVKAAQSDPTQQAQALGLVLVNFKTRAFPTDGWTSVIFLESWAIRTSVGL
jgi:hypothetical protein